VIHFWQALRAEGVSIECLAPDKVGYGEFEVVYTVDLAHGLVFVLAIKASCAISAPA
jgi:hypothetical protein